MLQLMPLKKRLLIIAITLLLISCKENVSGFKADSTSIQIDVLETGSAFTALLVKTNVDFTPKRFRLKQDGKIVSEGTISDKDTLLFVDSLSVASGYTFQAVLLYEDKEAAHSKEKSVLTLPLSSGSFSWRVDTIGAFPSDAYDMAAIDENNVWVVGQFPKYYGEDHVANAVKWNGSEYEYHHVQIKNGDTSFADPLQTTIAFSNNDVWFFTHSGGYAHFDGAEWKTDRVTKGARQGGVLKAWGFSSDDMYLIGTDGSITHYDGNNWSLMESGSDADLFDIHGYEDKESGEKVVWVTASGYPDGGPTLLKLTNGVWERVWVNIPIKNKFHAPHNIYVYNPYFIVLSVWGGINNEGIVYLADSKNINNGMVLTDYSVWDFSMAFLEINSIFLTGSWGELIHFNGQMTNMQSNAVHGGRNYAIKSINNKIYAVGVLGQEALFIHGVQN